MENPELIKGDGGEHIAIVHIRDITAGHGMFFEFDVQVGEGYYDPETDDFGEEAIAVVDEICVEHAIRIHEKLNCRRFYFGYKGVVEHNRKIAIALIRKLLEENPYTEEFTIDGEE